jgi:AraC-like DNA-binding protein
MIKIADATARIREQHDWYARTAGCAFQRHVTDFDVEVIEGRRLRFKERRLGGSRTSAGYEARSGSCRCAGEQVTARQSRFGHLIHSLTAWILWCIPRDRPKRSCPSWLTEGEHRPKFLPLQIAIQAGFGSLRRFNSVFAEVYGRPPSEIRRAPPSKSPRLSAGHDHDAGIKL